MSLLDVGIVIISMLISFMVIAFIILAFDQLVTAQQGDINDDGQVTITDYTLLRLDLIGAKGLSLNELRRADMNGDGYIDEYDLELIKERLLK